MAEVTAFRCGSSRAACTPKTASTQSPMNLMTVPPLLRTADSMSGKQRFIRLATSSGSMRPPREVKPEMSANSTVTWRRSPSVSGFRVSMGRDPPGSAVVLSGHLERDAGDEESDHRTGAEVGAHSRIPARRIGEGDEAERQQHQAPAQRAAEKPSSRPVRDANQEADQHACDVEAPHGDAAVQVPHGELQRMRAVDEERDPAEHRAEHGAEQDIRDSP